MSSGGWTFQYDAAIRGLMFQLFRDVLAFAHCIAMRLSGDAIDRPDPSRRRSKTTEPLCVRKNWPVAVVNHSPQTTATRSKIVIGIGRSYSRKGDLSPGAI